MIFDKQTQLSPFIVASLSNGDTRSSSLSRIFESLIVVLAITLCQLSEIHRSESKPTPVVDSTPIISPRPTASPLIFDAQRAFTELTELVDRGQRYYGAPQREEIIHWMSQRLSAAKLEVKEQRFTVTEPQSKVKYLLTNIVARFHPDRTQRIIIGSHWDTRLWAEEDHDLKKRNLPITGANDGSSGVAVLFEIGRQLSHLGLNHIGVDLILFDGEEFGRPRSDNYCVGSKFLANHLQDLYPHALPVGVIVIDMVGDRDLSFPPELSSAKHARALTQLVWREGVKLKLPAFISGLGGENHQGAKSRRPRSQWIIDDHSPFQELKIPATLLIDLDYPHWHTHQDTIDKVSPESLRQAGLALLASLKRLDHIASRASSTMSP